MRGKFLNELGLLTSELKFSIISMLSYIINLFPHPDNVVIFESNSDFCDNPKALFDMMVERQLDDKYQLVWVITDMESMGKYIKQYPNVLFIQRTRPALTKDFFTQIYYYSIAKFAFYSHSFIGMPSNRKQTRFFMTHAAIPIKNTRKKFWNYKRNTYILSTSEFAAFYRCISFGGGEDRVECLGFPRNDKLFVISNNIKEQLGLTQYKKIIMWMPTFKHHKSSGRNDFQNATDNDISLLTEHNVKKINTLLSEKNAIMVIKFHPAQNMSFVSNVNMSNIRTISNQELLQKEIELYSLLGTADALITDFSSVYFDYLLLDRPIGFELCDQDNYEAGMGFIMDKPEDFMPGHKIKNIVGLMEFLSDVTEDKDKFAEARNLLKQHVHKHIDNRSTERIIEFLKL